MMPKIIHYCWFGGNPLPELAVKCIESWKKYCPDYEIKRWDESNFDLNCCDYVKEACQVKKWAFVSDYVRFKVLYDEGGLYFDTDVELIKPIDDILARGPFMGVEIGQPINEKLQTKINAVMPDIDADTYMEENARVERDIYMEGDETIPDCRAAALELTCDQSGTTEELDRARSGSSVAPGLGLAANPGLVLYRKILNYYEKAHFIMPDGSLNQITVVMYTTEYLKRYGLQQPVTSVQKVAGVYVYPADYFCPMDYETGEIRLTENTRSIHHYMASWFNPREKRWHGWQQAFARKFGFEKSNHFFQSLPVRTVGRIYQSGWKEAWKRAKTHF